MECPSNWEYNSLIDELTQGFDQAKQLKEHLSSDSTEIQDLFMQRILSSFEKSLLILNCSGSAAQSHSQPTPPLAAVSGLIESSITVDNSPRSENLNTCLKDQKKLRRQSTSKKRKMVSTRTEQVRVETEHGLEGPSDDSFSWRKYGQKDIMGAKYPRSYYRCTYRHVRNCWATKYVQRSDDDPTVFDVTYKGPHTCYQTATATTTTNSSMVPPPLSPENQEPKHTTNHNTHQLQHPNEFLINFRANLRVNTEEPDDDTNNSSVFFPSTVNYPDGGNQFYQTTTNLVNEPFLGTYSPNFVSPTTPESSYFSGYMNSLGGASNWKHYESANASLINSPNAALDIPIEPVDLDPDFPFSMSVFFT